MPDGVDVKLIAPPTQAGLLLDAVRPRVLTVTFVVAVAEQPDPAALTVTVYTPAMPVVALAVNAGLCVADA